MTRSFTHKVLGVALVTAFLTVPASAADVPGSKDHPLVSRIPGSEILQYEEEEFGQLAVPLGAATGKGEFADRQMVEGRITRIGYRLPEDRAPLEAFRQYEQALDGADFQVLWRCAREKGDDGCGNWFSNNFNDLPGEKNIFHGETVRESEQQFLAARLRRPEGDVYVSVYAYPHYLGGNYARVRVAEVQPMEAGLVTVDAEALKRDLDRVGHVAVYGVTFDHDSDRIRAESKPALDEMAKLLEASSDLRVFIVGHTDNTGALDYNLDLSRRRAQSVVAALVERGIAGERLDGRGVGPLAPVASNDTEEGRAQNRRVELVKR